MSRLIQLRQRIKAIQTIKKVTHAMRLISMSSHVKLKAKQDYLTNYRQEIANLLSSIEHTHHEKSSPTTKTFSAPLIILIGSQKGLCGIFNTALFSFFETTLREKSWTHFSLIPIGKKAVDYATSHKQLTSARIDTYPTLTTGNHLHIAQKITDLLMSKKDQYSSIVVISNKLKSFFIQKPSMSTLLPLAIPSEPKKDASHAWSTGYQDTSYIWEQSPKEIRGFLTQQYFEASFQYLLFQSLLSEQAARFLSMDNATRNAENLLERTTLDYNKLRQAKITKELTELAGGFQKSG